jgi:retron-type reverse transcriptase
MYENGLKQGDVLSPLLCNFALEYAIRKFQENQVGQKLNGTHQLLAYADDVNLLDGNIQSVQSSRKRAFKQTSSSPFLRDCPAFPRQRKC